MTASGLLGVVFLVLQLGMIIIILSLPGRFKEQREYMDKKCAEIDAKLDALAASQARLTQQLEAQRREAQDE